MNTDYIKVATAAGSMEAEILRGLLESREVEVWVRRESAGTAVGLGVGPLGQVDLYVPSAQQEEAEAILDDYYSGRLDEES